MNIGSLKVLEDDFGQAIGARFDSLVFDFAQPVDIDSIADTLEDHEVEFDEDGDAQTITVPLDGGDLTLWATGLRYTSHKDLTPGALSALASNDIREGLPATALPNAALPFSSPAQALPEAEDN